MTHDSLRIGIHILIVGIEPHENFIPMESSKSPAGCDRRRMLIAVSQSCVNQDLNATVSMKKNNWTDAYQGCLERSVTEVAKIETLSHMFTNTESLVGTAWRSSETLDYLWQWFFLSGFNGDHI